MKCICCNEEFEIRPSVLQGASNRRFCYNCIPEGILGKDYNILAKAIMKNRINQEKIHHGCDICGYNKNASALEWHHDKDDKEGNPSDFLRWDKYVEYFNEIKKCKLLCANCHRELHNKKDIADIQEIISSIEISTVPQDNRNKIKESYLKHKSINQVAKEIGFSKEAISKVVKFLGIFEENNTSQPIKQLDKNTLEVLKIFPSIHQASIEVSGSKAGHSHIADVCKGRRKTAYGYKWQYVMQS